MQFVIRFPQVLSHDRSILLLFLRIRRSYSWRHGIFAGKVLVLLVDNRTDIAVFSARARAIFCNPATHPISCVSPHFLL